ncbi:MAG: hypothetical protein U0V87_01010 [Acidobacteriota bacterium]
MNRPLCDTVAELLERTYDIDRTVVPTGRFVVGDLGLRLMLQSRTMRERVDHDGSGARLLIRPIGEPGSWGAALYLPDALIDHLETHDPRRTLHSQNIDAFATLIEEIDHLVTFHDRVCRHGAELSLLDLEWHAVVSQYLVVTHFLARLSGRAQLIEEQRQFVEHHLFDKREYLHADTAVLTRYREAQRWGRDFVCSLRRLPPDQRLRLLRRFHRASPEQKRRMIT